MSSSFSPGMSGETDTPVGMPASESWRSASSRRETSGAWGSIVSDPERRARFLLSQGQTVVSEKADIRIQQDPGPLFHVPASADLADIVKSLNALGATAQDLIGILQAIKAAGALKAELEIL